jgi:hypothetical protein
VSDFFIVGEAIPTLQPRSTLDPHIVQVTTTGDYLILSNHHCSSKNLAAICDIKLLRVQVQRNLFTHIGVNHLLAFVAIFDFMLLDYIFTLIV